jgi:hypothetical protein
VCRAEETTVYTCDFGRRVVSVCATGDALSYRFGDARSTELEIVSTSDRPTAYFGGVIGGGGGSQNRLRFSRQGYQYIVHSMVAGSLTDVPGQRFSGVTVLHGEGVDAPVAANLDCPLKGEAQKLNLPPKGAWADEPDDRYEVWY